MMIKWLVVLFVILLAAFDMPNGNAEAKDKSPFFVQNCKIKYIFVIQ